MSKEEKAKEYVSNIDFSNSTGIYIVNEMKGTTYQGYIDGYTQAEQDLSSQLTACKEALREIIKEFEEWTLPTAEKQNNSGYYDYYVEIDDLKVLIAKAKTLIE